MAVTYNFKYFDIDGTIAEMYSRIGVRRSLITGEQILEAKTSLNLIFSEWLNYLNLWTVSSQMFSIIPGQASYKLPDTIGDILGQEMIVANINRQLSGFPSSSSGIAANAFDGNPATACIETAPNGWIAYDYGVGNQYSIFYVGIQSNIDITYSITIQYSYDDPTANTWHDLGTIQPQTYIKGIPRWYVINNPIMARSYRIIETGGATLNIEELYFMLAPYNSHEISRISRDTYLAYTNKSTQGVVSSFCYDRAMAAPVFLYLTPDNSYQFIIYNMKSYVKDVDSLTDNQYMPQRFFNAICAAGAAAVALKYAPEKFDLLNNLSQQAYTIAAEEDVETVPLTITLEGWF